MAELEYEPQDVNPRTVVKAAVVLAGLSVLGAAVSLGVFLFLARQAREGDRPLPPLAQHEPGRLPPEPRLQPAPQAELVQVREEARRRLTRYGWIDPQAGIVHIPIEEAMKIYAQRAGGRPVPQAPSPAASPASSPAPSPPGPREHP